MSGKYVISVLDYSKESSRMSVYTPELNAGNIVAQLALQATLHDAVEAVCLGTMYKSQSIAVETITPRVPPGNKAAQIETKWLVSCSDDVTGFPVSFTIPCASSDFITNNTDLMDLAGTEGAALVAAIEAVVKSKAGNAVSVVEIRLVGRNL